MEGIGRVDRRGTSFDVVCAGPFAGDDQRAFELPQPLLVHPEVRLQRRRQMHARRNVDEGSARPHRRVQRRELVVRGRNHRPEILAEELGVILHPVLDGVEDHALGLPFLLERVVDHLGVVLGPDARQDAALGFRDAQPLEGLLDVLRHVVPGAFHLLLGPHVEVRLGKRFLKFGEIPAPPGHRLRLVDPQRLQAALQHPLRLVLARRDLAHHIGVESGAGPKDGLRIGDEPELVVIKPQSTYDFIAGHLALPVPILPAA